MKQMGKLLLGFVVFCLVAAIAGIVSNQKASAVNTQPVTVTNTPLPVDAAQSGTWNVGINGTPTVALSSGTAVGVTNNSNSPLFIRDVDRPTAQPFNYSDTLQWASGFLFANADGVKNFTVPSGKQLVVQFVTLQIAVTGGDKVNFARLDTDAGSIVVSLNDAGIGGDGHQIYTATQRVFTILGPGTKVTPTAYCGNSGTDGCANGTVNILVSGYYVSAS